MALIGKVFIGFLTLDSTEHYQVLIKVALVMQ